MLGRSSPAGESSQSLGGMRALSETAAAAPEGVWDGYLEEPDEDKLGICTSGGGIRSAAFCLGALQTLRASNDLGRARYLACVSGGGYAAIAHVVLASETLKRADANGESHYFHRQPPYAPDSPEERHLRDNLNYLAPGLIGRVWLGVNLLYGFVRQLVPFLTVIYLAAFVGGIAYSHWLGTTLRKDAVCPPLCAASFRDLQPFLLVALALIATGMLLMVARGIGQLRWSDETTAAMQFLVLLAIGLSALVVFIFWLLPFVLIELSRGFLRVLAEPILAGGLAATAGAVSTGVAWLLRHRTSKWVKIGIAVLTTLSAPIAIFVPLVGLTYWNAFHGMRWSEDTSRFVLAGVAILVLVAYELWSNQTAPVAHLFYRDRLATVFIGYRDRTKRDGKDVLGFKQPAWSAPIHFSSIRGGEEDGQARMPNLVVCAAANLSSSVPTGRLATPFTFERDRVGGPLVKYQTTAWLEGRAGVGTATLPALMAVSGAAVAPSMGKMTIPPLRFLMALFNLRLGVWLPNPYLSPRSVSAEELRSRHTRALSLDAPEPTLSRLSRPGPLYLLREAFGLNSIRNRFLYVTDGGHWENLGVVELLRRGCGRIICIDGSGGDTTTFGTLSEAISLARSDLGISIDIDLSDLKADASGISKKPFAIGRITFPNHTEGVLVYVRALVPKSAPQDLLSYAMTDRRFPNHPTSDQFFNEKRFEAYRSLGAYLAAQVVRCKATDADPPDPPGDCP